MLRIQFSQSPCPPIQLHNQVSSGWVQNSEAAGLTNHISGRLLISNKGHHQIGRLSYSSRHPLPQPFVQ